MALIEWPKSVDKGIWKIRPWWETIGVSSMGTMHAMSRLIFDGSGYPWFLLV